MSKKGILIFLFCFVLTVPCYLILNNLTPNLNQYFSINGVDISNSYKGELNWSKLKGCDDFVVLRAVRCIDTNKRKGQHSFISVVDSNFNKNWLSLEKTNIIRGAYHFFAPDISAEDQFQIFKENVHLKKGDLPPILDVEMKECNMNEVMKWLEMARKHYKTEPILYTDYFFYKWYLNSKNDKFSLWLYINENFMLMPSFENPKCLFWQYKHDEKIPGFNENVDLNAFLGDSVAFKNILVK